MMSFEIFGLDEGGAMRRRLARAVLFGLGFGPNLAFWYAIGRLVEARVR